MSASFKAFRQFNDPQRQVLTGLRMTLGHAHKKHFSAARHMDRLALSIAERRVLPLKELFESAELYMRVRRRIRAQTVADLCAGHGLVGLLFAAFERSVERVILLDRRQPDSFARIREAVIEVAPWVADKVTYIETSVEQASQHLPDGAGLIGVHACGVRTDRCLELAVEKHSPVAVMPCCYAQTAKRAPRALVTAMGAELATDIDRTYRLERAGFSVAWSEIPVSITPKNRVIIGLPEPLV